MIASCADRVSRCRGWWLRGWWLRGWWLRGSALRGSALSSAARAALCAGVLCGAGACSESQYNPPIGGGGSSSAGSGGSSAQAGSAGSGTSNAGSAGVSGGAGTAGSGGGEATPVYGFESSLEGFFINYFCTGPGAGENCTQLQAQQPEPSADAGTDAGEGADAAPPSDSTGSGFITLEHDTSVGDPDPGSAKLTFQFTAGRQSANLAMNFGSADEPGIDLSGKVLRARVRAEAGAPETAFAKLYIKTTGTYYYADAGEVTLVAGNWTSLAFDTGLAPAYPAQGMLDTSQYQLEDVREIGIELGASAAAAAATAVIHVDSISY